MSKLQDRLGTACHVEVHTRQSRDSRDAFVPVEPDVTAPRDRKSGITFSHGKNVSIPQRTLKKIAADMIDCLMRRIVQDSMILLRSRMRVASHIRSFWTLKLGMFPMYLINLEASF